MMRVKESETPTPSLSLFYICQYWYFLLEELRQPSLVFLVVAFVAFVLMKQSEEDWTSVQAPSRECQLRRRLLVAGVGEVLICKGDLTVQQTDAIVNAANTDLWMGGGVAGAIRRSGGPSIQEECRAWIQVTVWIFLSLPAPLLTAYLQEHGTVATGQVAWTGGGNLHCKYGR